MESNLPYYVRFKNMLVLFYLAICGYSGFLIYLVPSIPLVYFFPTLHSKLSNKFISLWFLFATLLIEKIIGTKFNLYMEETEDKKMTENQKSCYLKNSLFISNHCGCLDWIYIARIVSDYYSIDKFKVVLKDVLKHLPGAGWAMQIGLFLFLKRNWETDIIHVNNYIEYYKKNALKLQLLIFPEGTYMTANTKNNSDKFAKKMGFPYYHHVLHPRTRGFTHILQLFSNNPNNQDGKNTSSTTASNNTKSTTTSNIGICNNHANSIGFDSIIDFTLAFTGDRCFKEIDVVKGRLPTKIDIMIKKYDIEQMEIDSEEKMDLWLREIWKQKETTLNYFSKNSKFPADLNVKPVHLKEFNTGRYLPAVLVFIFSNYITLYALLNILAFKIYAFVTAFVIISSSYFGRSLDKLCYKL